jgi:parallel beta-helix repeat protein
VQVPLDVLRQMRRAFVATESNCSNNNQRGIALMNGARDNSILRNTAERNRSGGIDIDCDSSGNLVERNLLTANGDGVRLLGQPTNNRLLNNTIVGNYHGITFALGSATGNIVQANELTLNVIGISVDAGATGNTFAGNTALENNDFDLFDENGSAPSCGNTWPITPSRPLAAPEQIASNSRTVQSLRSPMLGFTARVPSRDLGYRQ